MYWQVAVAIACIAVVWYLYNKSTAPVSAAVVAKFEDL